MNFRNAFFGAFVYRPGTKRSEYLVFWCNYLKQQLPSDDYWYIIQLEDGKVLKGHFALKR